jgi:hypothetical protein
MTKWSIDLYLKTQIHFGRSYGSLARTLCIFLELLFLAIVSFPRQGVIHCFEQRIMMSLTYSKVQIQAKHIMTAKNRGLH